MRQYIGAPRPPCANILALRCPRANSISISNICQAFSPVVRIGTPQALNLQVSVFPPFVTRGGYTCSCRRGGGWGPNTSGQTLCYSRYHVSFTSPIGGPNIKNLKKQADRTFRCASPIFIPTAYKLGFTNRKRKHFEVKTTATLTGNRH